MELLRFIFLRFTHFSLNPFSYSFISLHFFTHAPRGCGRLGWADVGVSCERGGREWHVVSALAQLQFLFDYLPFVHEWFSGTRITLNWIFLSIAFSIAISWCARRRHHFQAIHCHPIQCVCAVCSGWKKRAHLVVCCALCSIPMSLLAIAFIIIIIIIIVHAAIG